MAISENIILLYKTKYYDFSFNHFKEFLKKDENIDVSYEFVYKTLTKIGVLSPKARRKTKRAYAKNKLLSEKKINLAMADEQILELKELTRNERFSKEFDELVEVKERKKYIPPMSHPWKLESFKKQLQRSHYQHQYA